MNGLRKVKEVQKRAKGEKNLLTLLSQSVLEEWNIEQVLEVKLQYLKKSADFSIILRKFASEWTFFVNSMKGK